MVSLFSKKWFQLIIIIGGIILVIFGLYKILVPSGKVSQVFINKFNEVSNLAEDIANTSALDLTGLEEKEAAGDFAGALEITNKALVKNTETTAKIKNLVDKTTELKELAQKITDSSVKESALKVIGLIEQNNDLGNRYLNIQKQTIELISDYYEKQQAGQKVSIPEQELTDLSNQATELAQELKEISAQYTTALDEFAKNARITFKKK